MKKIMMIAAMMVAAVTANAQNEVGQITLKPTVGLNIATMTKIDGSKVRPGFIAGVEAEYGVAENFGITAGIFYSQQGAKESGEININRWVEGERVGVKFKGDATNKLDYINIPIMAQYYVVPGLAIKAGIQPGFLVTKKAKYDGTLTAVVAGESASKPYTESVTISDAKGFAFAIPVGLSYEYANFVLDARYNIGVTKAIKEYDCRHSVFSFTLGYKFAL
jgi:hypothetical protein